MNGVELLDRFYLDQNLTIHQEIEPVPRLDQNALELDIHFQFALNNSSSHSELVRQARAIGAFEQAGPKL